MKFCIVVTTVALILPVDDDDRDDDSDYFDTGLTAKIKAQFNKMSAEEQESYSQENMNLRALLRLDPNHVYTTEDLQSESILERALRLLFNAEKGLITPIFLNVFPKDIRILSFPLFFWVPFDGETTYSYVVRLYKCSFSLISNLSQVFLQNFFYF